jgi:hypothetical protein
MGIAKGNWQALLSLFPAKQGLWPAKAHENHSESKAE